MKRLVKGIIHKLSDEPWKNLRVVFKLNQGSYTAAYQYPIDEVVLKTDEFGRFEGFFWCNEEGLENSFYQIYQPFELEGVKFNVPIGTTPIELSVLRQGGITPIEPQYPTLITYFENYINEQLNDLSIGQNKELISNSLIATTNLSALRLINLTNSSYADFTTIGNNPIGFLKNSVNQGSTFETILQGTIFDAGWNWLMNKPLFLGNNGFILQNIPSSAEYIIQVGKVLNPQTIQIQIKEAINNVY
jgi:hypothetical protein